MSTITEKTNIIRDFLTVSNYDREDINWLVSIFFRGFNTTEQAFENQQSTIKEN